ncbi:MAG: hypothetical protein QOI34_1033 [Verrucomicrobiota bacterium]
MKTLYLICACSLGFALTGLSQNPTVSPATSPLNASPVTASITPSPSATVENDLADKIHRRIDKKMKQKGIHFSIGDDDEKDVVGGSGHGSHDDIPPLVVPLVGIIFLTVFGAPVLIVGVIMYFGFSRNRMMHRTVRMMVEKGQEVPAALLVPPPAAVRQRSDMRRGVVLVMVGVGLMLFFAAVNNWEGGAWAIGIIPFLIGAGYLLVWKLDGGQKPKTDNPPSLP